MVASRVHEDEEANDEFRRDATAENTAVPACLTNPFMRSERRGRGALASTENSRLDRH